jgi:hypothetical protein
MMMDWVSSRPAEGCGRSLLFRPSDVCLPGTVSDADSVFPELAAVDSYRLIVAPLICTVAVLRSSRSDVGERVVAKLGQDVAGLPDDLAGLR